MKDVKTLVLEYRDITVNMIDAVNEEKFEKLNVLIESREEILNTLKKLEMYNKNEVVANFKNLDIMSLEKKVKKLTEDKFNDVKEKLRSINSNQIVNKKYYKDFSGNPLFFNKKIY